MMPLRIFLERLRGLFSPGRYDGRLDEEVAAHLDALAAEHESRGMPPADARLAALRDFGGATQMKEAHRDQRSLPFAETFAKDLRYALRQMRANPAFAAAAILTLALGIGANTAIFRVLDAVALRSLPVKSPEQLVVVRALVDDAWRSFNYPLFREMAAQQRAVDEMFAVADVPVKTAAVQGLGPLDGVTGSFVSGGYFRILGLRASMGRLFGEGDDQRSAPAVAVISDGFWQRVFGGKPDALGRTMRINNAIATIIGVTPPGFFGEQVGRAPDVWLPMSVEPGVSDNWLDSPAVGMLSVMARLRRDVAQPQAQAALTLLYQSEPAAIAGQVAGPNKHRIELLSGNQGLEGLGKRFAAPLSALMGIVALVLLIACCNLANLLLARSSARTHEIGVRLAIGAGRGRIVRQLLTESLLLAAMGSAIGFAAAAWGSRELVALASAGEHWRLALDGGWRVLGFTAAIAAAAVCIFGLAPALAATRLDAHSALQANGRTATQGRSGQGAARAFVVAQIAVSLVLIAGASLLIQSFRNLRNQDFGYRQDGILIARMAFDMSTFSVSRDPAQLQSLYLRLNAIPGIRSAAFAGAGPLGLVQSAMSIALPDRPSQANEDARAVSVSPGYFETMGIPILAGRAINDDDRAKGAPVAVLSETAAKRLFGSANPLGRFVTWGKVFKAEASIQVVGVARDIRFSGPRDPFGALAYLPMAQRPAPLTSITLRTAGDPALFAAPVRQAIHEVSPRLRLASIQPLGDLLGGMMRQEKMMALLSGAFGALALILAAVGLYGVVAYGVQRRTQEIGIRLALGATRGQVAGLLLREVGLLAAGGLLVGAVVTMALGRYVQTLLFGLTANDPAMLALAAAALSAIAMAAAYVPARRAAKLDPMHALRQE